MGVAVDQRAITLVEQRDDIERTGPVQFAEPTEDRRHVRGELIQRRDDELHSADGGFGIVGFAPHARRGAQPR